MKKTSILLIIIFFLINNIVNSQIFIKKKENYQLQSIDTFKHPSDSIEIKYIVSKFDNKDSLYIDTLITKKILASKSALVLIDLWDESFLNPMIKEFINPLVTEAEKIGIHIIYSPSQKKQNKNLKIVNNSITIYDLDIMDEYINKNKINNIMYVGFDALYCIIDKPNGIYSFKQRYPKNINFFVFDKGVTSYTKEMKETAISLFKKNNIGIIQTEESHFKNIFPYKTNRNVSHKTKHTPIPEESFVLIFRNNISNTVLDNFIKKLKTSNFNYGQIINGKLYYKDRIINNYYNFINLLIKLKINNLYYAGYYLNNEILWSEYGITNLYIRKRYHNIKKIPNIGIINDLVYIVKNENIDPVLEKAVIINHYRKIKIISSERLFIKKTNDTINKFLRKPVQNNKKHVSR